MAIAMLAWLVAIPLLGFMTGLRSMTPMAVLCWFSYFHTLPLGHTWAFWTERGISVIIFTLLAFGEFGGDKLPIAPNRTKPFPLTARLCFGGLLGAITATALHGSALEGILLGAVGALAGSYLGLYVRIYIPKKFSLPDFPVAVAEDFVAILGSLLALRIIAA